MSDFKVGKVTHYFDKLGVAIVELSGNIAVGDRIKFVKGSDDLFEQSIESIQIEHQKFQTATSGQVVGIKTDKEVKEGAEVFKI